MVYLGLGGAEQMSVAIQGVAAETGKQYGTRWKATLDAYDRTGNDPQFESRMRRNTEACINRHLNRR